MVKQFTIPCDFQGQMSPVTLYIGHPEATHHPINFQSQWLSSARGGQVPSDLMDTLQKLHDLAIENNADFEELCYYALISATNNSAGNGVSPDDINNYADDFLKKEASGVKPDMPTDNNIPQDNSQTTTQAQNVSENNNVDANGNVITKTQATSSETTGTAQSTTANTTATDNNTNNPAEPNNTANANTTPPSTTSTEPQKVIPTIDTTTATPPTKQTEDELTKPVSNISENTKNIVEEATQSTYSAEDEDLLLMDDMTPIDNVINAEKTDNNNSDDNNNTDTNNTSTTSSNSSVYDDEDADLLG